MSNTITFPFKGAPKLPEQKKVLVPGTRIRVRWDLYAEVEAVVVPKIPSSYPDEIVFCITKVLTQLKYGVHHPMAPLDAHTITDVERKHPVYFLASDMEVLGYCTRKVGKFIDG